jgi:acetylornithine deacetylase/succinyl-diaminopimelate desuccinylase-like protein
MTSQNITDAISYYKSHYDDLFEQYKALLRIPSISTSDEAKADVQKAANYLVEKLKSIGLHNVKAYETPRHPLISGKHHPSSPRFAAITSSPAALRT